MSRSLVSLVYTKFEQGPFSFIELLVYAVGLRTFTFLLSFHLGLTRSEAEQGPISLFLSFDLLELCLDQGGKVSPRKSVVHSACQYDVTSRVSDFQNGKQSVHRRDG